MKTTISSRERGSFSLLDLIVMIVAVGAVVGVGYLYTESQRTCCSPKAQQITCLNNLKQLGLSYRLWGGDNGEKYPSQVSTNAGGTMELVADGFAFPDFLVMSNELGTPKIVVCPNDGSRSAVSNFAALKSDANVSYFKSPEADESRPDLWLAGDRNLATNTVALKPGLFVMPTNRVVSWTAQIHKHKGYIAQSDGSVQEYTSTRLQSSFTNALRAYRGAMTNGTETAEAKTFRLAIP